MRTFGLFAGIGGLELGLSMGGPFESIGFCEQNLYARAVLAKNWPGVPQYDDVRTLTGHALAADGIGRIDVLTGGWPCQPHSVAGKRANSEDDRDLWAEFARLVGETRPRWVVGENVPGVLSSHDAAADRGAGGFFGRVLRDLAALRYDAEWQCFPASALGAHHIRERIFVVAYPSELFGNGGDLHGEYSPRPLSESGNRRGPAHVAHASIGQSVKQNGYEAERGWQANTKQIGLGSNGPIWAGGDWEQPSPLSFSAVRGMADGLPAAVDRLRCLGNGVVPQQAAVIGRAITEAEAHHARFGVMPDQIVQPRHLVAR